MLETSITVNYCTCEFWSAGYNSIIYKLSCVSIHNIVLEILQVYKV